MADQSDRNCIAPARQGMTRKPYKSWQQGISLRGCRARWFPYSRQCGEWSQKDYLESLPVVRSCYRRGQAISDSISRLQAALSPVNRCSGQMSQTRNTRRPTDLCRYCAYTTGQAERFWPDSRSSHAKRKPHSIFAASWSIAENARMCGELCDPKFPQGISLGVDRMRATLSRCMEWVLPYKCRYGFNLTH